jgi:hypothetical protein
MYYAYYGDVTQVKDWLVSVNNETLTNIFRPPAPLDQDTLNSINNEIVQTQNLEKSVSNTLDWPCASAQANSQLNQNLKSLENSLIAHVAQIHAMTETDMMEVQDDIESTGTSPWFQFETNQATYQNLLSAAECSVVCPAIQQMPYANNGECFDNSFNGNVAPQDAAVYDCDTNNPMVGIAFTHNYGDNLAYEERISVYCMSDIPLFETDQSSTTQWQRNTATSSTGNENACPDGMFVSTVAFTHECGENYTYERYVQLTCEQPSNGYSLATGTQYTTDWVVTSPYGSNAAVLSCNPGDVMIGIDFTHPNSENYTQEESVRIHCQTLGGGSIYCPASSN